MLPQELVDIAVLISLFFVRIGGPLAIILAFGYWLQRKLRPQDFPPADETSGRLTWRQKVTHELNRLPAWLPVIVLTAVTGGFAAFYRLALGLGTVSNLNQGYPWGLWIGFDLFMVAFSGGAFTLAAIVYVFNLRQFHAAIRPTVLTGLLGYTSVLLILFMDLGRWDRFYHFLIYPNFNSAMFEVSWCIFLYSMVLIAEFSPVAVARTHWDKLKNFVRKLPVPLAIIGGTLSTLHQSSLGTLYVVVAERVHPLWHTSIIPLLFFISSIAAGLAMVIAGATVSFWVFKRSLNQKLVGGLGRFLPWVLGIYVAIKGAELIASGDWQMLMTGDRYSDMFMFEILVGVFVPIVMFSMPAVRSSRGWSLVAAATVLFGVFLNRFNVTWFTLKPAAGYSYFPSLFEIAIQLGVFAAMITVYTVVGFYLPLFEGVPEAAQVAREEELELQPALVAHTPRQ